VIDLGVLINVHFYRCCETHRSVRIRIDMANSRQSGHRSIWLVSKGGDWVSSFSTSQRGEAS